MTLMDDLGLTIIMAVRLTLKRSLGIIELCTELSKSKRITIGKIA